MKIFKKESTLILLLLMACSLLFFFKLGSYKLIDVDEPRYAEAAREMLESSDWITPYFNYELRFDKPIFFYWLVMISFLFFGITEFAARFPSAIMATALVFFTYYFGKTMISRSFGLISSLILASSLEFIAMSRMSITDMTLTFLVCATTYSGLLAMHSENSSKKYWWWFAYLFSGIAILTKGPIGFILPAIILGLFAILTGKLKESFNPKFFIPGFLILIYTATPWYYAIIQEHGSAFIDYFFIKHNISRFSGEFVQHQQPFYFYFIVVLAGFFPWSIYFVAGFIKTIKDLYNHISNPQIKLKKLNFSLFENTGNKTKLILASTIWFLSVLILFSISKAKLITYILPLFPAMALLTGNIWHEFIERMKNAKLINISARILAIICIIAGIIGAFGLNLVLPRDEKLAINSFNPELLIIFCVIPAFLLFYLHKNQRIKAFIVTIIFMSSITLAAINNVIPIVYNSGQKDLIDYITLSKNNSLFNDKLVAYNLTKPSLVFYSQSKIDEILTPQDLSKRLSQQEPVLVVVKNKRFYEIESVKNYHIIKKGVKYTLISNINFKTP
ncbi:MAG: hypothetical protein ACD_20C00301G0014 [uncultured bacterium]|nr:MAG: hypothetical protein ACD_20C00301G0014 [uncultured bacterium]